MPRLTGINQHHEILAHIVVHALINAINDIHEPISRVITPELIIRESDCCADKDENGDMIAGTDRITSDYTEANNHKYYMGSRIPDLYGSLSTNLSFKGIDLSVLTTYSIGGKVYDALYAGAMNIWYPTDIWPENYLRRWQKPGDITDIPRVEIASYYASYMDRNLIDASYFAIKNITIGYTLQKGIVSKAGLENVRLFTSVDNLALFTHLDGMDPQYNFSGGTSYDYVPNKTWTVGLEVKF